MQDLKKALKETVEYTDAIIATRIQRRNANGLTGVPWREDPTLKAIMTDLKSQAHVISHSAVKFALLVNTSSPSDSNLSRNIASICEEIGPQIGTFYNIFLRLSECAIAECLFDEAAHCVRSMLGIFQELLTFIEDRKREAINYSAGEMTKVLSDVAENLPLANKAAYRRYLAKKCKGLKEIVDEFSGYLDEAKEAMAKLVGDDAESAHIFEKLSLMGQPKAAVSVEDAEEEEEEEDEDDMEERDYYPAEVPLVEGAVALIQRTLDTIKVCTVALTNISDTLLASSLTTSEDGSVDSEASRKALIIPHCNAWVVSVLATVDHLESSCIDLGAALYPPVLTTNTDLISAYDTTLTSLQALLKEVHESTVLDQGKYHPYCEAKIQLEILKIYDIVVALPAHL